MKPIHKFNNGNGATLCNECGIIINEGFSDLRRCEACGGDPEEKPYWKLTRLGDGKTHRGEKYTWVEWNEDSRFKAAHDKPQIGFSFLLDPHPVFFGWQTTQVTEIIREEEYLIEFKTKNSHYLLEKEWPDISGTPI